MESTASFPSPVESTVASALLLLSSISPTSPPCSHLDDSGSLFPPINSISKSRASSSSTMTSSSPETRGGGRQLRLVSVFAGYHDMQFKVVRKSRSKTLWISVSQKNTSSKVPMSSSETVSETTETSSSSCLTTGSIYSSVSSGGGGSSITATARPRRKGEWEKEVNVARGGLKMEQVYYSAKLSRRAQAILKLLCDGCCLSEVKIRELLGDSPDTSKALRMLLRKEHVRRSGAGGRADPFVYRKA